MPEETPHVRVTLQTIYDKQLDNEKLLVRTLERLDGLSDVPDRLRAVETAQAAAAWVPKVVLASLVAGISGLVTALFTVLRSV
jgi:vacuolar-type H+-ATPase subunit I/STV1